MVRQSSTLDAEWLYGRGVIECLRYDAERGGMVLYDAALIEDDADGCGFPYAQDVVAGPVRIRKRLRVDRPAARAAHLLVYHAVEVQWESEPHVAPVRISVNGHGVQAVLQTGWNAIAVNPAWLVRGGNEFILAALDDAAPPIIPVAGRDDILANAPDRASGEQRSFRSADGGATWSEELGGGSRAAGEYLVRLHLDQRAAAGEYVSPIVDVIDPLRAEPLKRRTGVRSLAASFDGDAPAGTRLSCRVRTGTAPVLDAGEWGDWQEVIPGGALAPRGRYAQFRFSLESDDPLATPLLRALAVEADVEPLGAAAPGVRVESLDCRPIVRGSLPFEYEPLDHPRLRELRGRYGLEEVVAGAEDQLGRILRLNHWVSQQWDWHPPVDYPDWDALRILAKGEAGEPLGGFCGHYAIVMVQCCLALGMQARFVFGDLPGVIFGHEVTEVWSDQFGKWILMDPNMDRHYLDRESRTPLNALELHRAVLRHFFPDGCIGDPEDALRRVSDAAFAEFLERGPVIVHGGNVAGPDWFDPARAHLMWGRPAMMPRNNWLARPRPMPKAHGYGLPWSWNGYAHWYDPATPRQRVFQRYTDRECDFYWDLNRVDVVLEETGEPGILCVVLDTFTPDREAFLVAVDDGPWRVSELVFDWRLRTGANRLRARVRNSAGVEGMPAEVRVSRTD